MTRPPLNTRHRLNDVRYEIRGELARRARELESEGHELIKLNIGNPGAFGFRAPEHLAAAIADGLARSDAYAHQQGLPEAREAVATMWRGRGLCDADAADVFIGNGVSELIDLSLRALLDPGDEVLLPSPDYPLWTAATILNDGVPVHYPCRDDDGFLPDPEAVRALVGPRTRALVVINPNNPTGASYPPALLKALVDIAREHDLLLMADEIYDGIVYDDTGFQPLAPLAGEVPCLSLGGLSKVHRACGWRVGWGLLGGDRERTAGYRHALDLLGALRLCANVPGQFAVAPALSGPDTITPLCRPGGRLHASRQAVVDACAASPHLELVTPQAAMYAFPRVVGPAAEGFDDHRFALELLESGHVLVVPGSSFNLGRRDHFRVTLLPEAGDIAEVFRRIDRILDRYAQAGAARHVA